MSFDIQLLRFKDLRRAGVVSSWPQLRYLQKNHGFPAGLLLGSCTRAWHAAEIEKWLADRPRGPSAVSQARVEKSKRARQEIAEAAA
jgi:predicted DNA-binding transcriptional regulator AlpA